MKTTDFNACVDKYADGLFRFACRILGNESEAKDVVQQVFEKFWLKRDKINLEKAKSYLFTSIHNTSVDVIRKRKRRQGVELPGPQQTERPDAFEIRDAIQLALNELPEVQRTVILLRDYEGYPYEEIAEMTGLSISQVKVYIYRARKKLQVQLKHFRYA